MEDNNHAGDKMDVSILAQDTSSTFSTLHPLPQHQQQQQHQHSHHNTQQHHHHEQQHQQHHQQQHQHHYQQHHFPVQHPVTGVLDSVQTINFQTQPLGEFSSNFASENNVPSLKPSTDQDVTSYNSQTQTMDANDNNNDEDNEPEGQSQVYEIKPDETTSRLLLSLLEQLYCMQNSNQYTDTAIVYSYHDCPVNAHAAVLAASIPAFKHYVKVSATMNTDYKYCLSLDTLGLELSRPDMDCFVRFCYTREFRAYKGMSCEKLIVLAKEMGLDALVIYAQTFHVEQEMLDEQRSEQIVEQTREQTNEHTEKEEHNQDNENHREIEPEKVTEESSQQEAEDSDDELPQDDFPVRFNDEDELVVVKKESQNKKSAKKSTRGRRLKRNIKHEKKTADSVRNENETDTEEPEDNTEAMSENEFNTTEANEEKKERKNTQKQDQSNPKTSATPREKKCVDYSTCKLCHAALTTRTWKGYMLHKKNDCVKMKFRNHTGPKCRKCQLTFSTHEDLDAHIKSVHLKRYQCAECNEIFQREELLVMHMHSQHSYPIPEEKFDLLICKFEDCTYRTIVKEEFRAHTTQHLKQQQQQGKNDTLCVLCGKNYKTKASLYSHRRKIHTPSSGPKPQCQQCGKLFKNNTTLQSHIKWAHEKSDPLLCNHCPYSVRTPREFYNHLMVEHQVEPPSNFKKHECKDCGYRTLNKNYYEIHCRKHTGEKPYQCSECGHAFTSQSELSSHAKWHVSERPFPCPHCEHRAIDRTKLHKHIEYMHTAKDDKKWECHKCTYKSNIKGNLRMHLKKIHKIEVQTQRHLIQDPRNIIVGRTNVRLVAGSNKARKRLKPVATDIPADDPNAVVAEQQILQQAPPPLTQPSMPQNVLVVSNPTFHSTEQYYDAIPVSSGTGETTTILTAAQVPLVGGGVVEAGAGGGGGTQLVVEHGIPVVQDASGATQILMRRPVNMMLGDGGGGVGGQHEVVISSTADHLTAVNSGNSDLHHHHQHHHQQHQHHPQQQQQQQQQDIIIPVISSAAVDSAMVANAMVVTNADQQQQQQQQQFQTIYTNFPEQQLYSGQMYMN